MKKIVLCLSSLIILSACNAGSGSANSTENFAKSSFQNNISQNLQNFVYTMGTNTITSYTVDKRANLSILNSVKNKGKLLDMVMDTYKQHLYVLVPGQILVYDIGSSHKISNNYVASVNCNDSTFKLNISPDGMFLYAITRLDNTNNTGSIQIYGINNIRFLSQKPLSTTFMANGYYPETINFIGNSGNYYAVITNSGEAMMTYKYTNNILQPISMGVTTVNPGLLVTNRQQNNNGIYTFTANTYPSSSPMNHQTIAVQEIDPTNGIIASYTNGAQQIISPINTPIAMFVDKNRSHVITLETAYSKSGSVINGLIQVFNYNKENGAWSGGLQQNISHLNYLPVLSASFDNEKNYLYVGTNKGILIINDSKSLSNLPVDLESLNKTIEPVNKIIVTN